MWGFDLDMTAVRLMRRDNGNWQEVAAEKIEGADIEERLMALVDRIDSDAPVELFLPRDQILYTDVAITDEESARDEIERALEGATPYPTDELDMDWEITSPGTARVAAIALETLDEAVAFAEVRGVKVGGFSSLAVEDHFPRLPDFTGHSIFYADDPEEDDIAAAPVTFYVCPRRVPAAPRRRVAVAGRRRKRPRHQGRRRSAGDADQGARAAAAGSRSADLQSRHCATGAHRYRITGRLGQQVASLTPPAVKVRSGPAFWKIGAVLALALLMTVGIATLVWQLLPLGPGSSDVPLSEESGAGITAPAEEAQPVETVEAPAEEMPEVPEPVETVEAPTEPAPEEPEPVETVEAPEDAVPDLPLPSVVAEVATFPEAPGTDEAPRIAALAPVDQPRLPEFKTALRAGEGLPFVDLGLPAEPTPAALAAILTTGPDHAPAPSGDTEDPTLDIYIASVDLGDLSFDAIALPEPSALAASALPFTGSAPVETPEEPAEDASQVWTRPRLRSKHP